MCKFGAEINSYKFLMNTTSHNKIVSFIWSIADDCLRDVDIHDNNWFLVDLKELINRKDKI